MMVLGDAQPESGELDAIGSGRIQVRWSAFRSLMGDARPGERFLDVGCGTGRTLSWAAERLPQGRVVGLDASRSALVRARSRLAPWSQVDLILGDVSDPALRTLGPFGRVYSAEALYRCAEPLQALDELRQNMSDGARLACLLTYYQENIGACSEFPGPQAGLTLLSQAGWRRCFRDAGFDVVRQERLHPSLESFRSLPHRGVLFFLATA